MLTISPIFYSYLLFLGFFKVGNTAIVLAVLVIMID